MRILLIEDDRLIGDGLNAGCVFERRAILRDGIEGRAGKHRTVVIIRIGKFARLFRYGGRSADGQRQQHGQRQQQRQHRKRTYARKPCSERAENR